LKFQAVAEKTAKDARGYFILPHPVVPDAGAPLPWNLGTVLLSTYVTIPNWFGLAQTVWA